LPGSEAIQRYWPNEGESHDLVRSDNGMFVFYADHKRIVNHLELGYGQERTALRAEITQLREDLKTERARTAPVSAAVAERDREWHRRTKKLVDLLNDEIDCDVDGPYWVYTEASVGLWNALDDLRSLLPPAPEIPGFEGTRGQVDGLVEAALPRLRSRRTGEASPMAETDENHRGPTQEERDAFEKCWEGVDPEIVREADRWYDEMLTEAEDEN
jgi:hypothetical protein